MRTSVRCLGFVLASVASAMLHAGPRDAEHVEVALVGDAAALTPGRTAWLGLALRHDPGWHTYWIDPGDSGLPTKLRWTLPAGFKAGDIAWPTPKRFQANDLYSFGYDGDVVLPVPIDVPADARPGTRVTLSVVAKWLVCHEECIPGTADLKIDLPIAAAGEKIPAATADRQRIAAARSRIPQAGVWTARSALCGERIEVTLSGANLPPAAKVDAFAVAAKVVANAPPKATLRGRDLVLVFAKSDYFISIPDRFELVLVDGDDAPARLVQAPFVRADPACVVSR